MKQTYQQGCACVYACFLQTPSPARASSQPAKSAPRGIWSKKRVYISLFAAFALGVTLLLVFARSSGTGEEDAAGGTLTVDFKALTHMMLP